jgi:hypothetical protein
VSVLGIDPIQAFNLLLDRLDNLVHAVERIADAIEEEE